MASYITTLVIQKNVSVFIAEDGISAEKSGSAEVATGLGVSMEVPCPDSTSGGVIDGDFWAVPVNEGLTAGFNYVPYNNVGSPSAPTPASFAVVRISSRFSADVWYVLGTAADYIASCAVCCSDSPVPMPDAADLPLQPGCQTLCQFNNGTDKQYFGILGLPALTGNKRYFPYGYFNGVALPAASTSGYVSTTTLLTFLNTAVTGWAAVGVWTVSSDHLSLIVTQTDGPGTDVLCAAVAAINPSL
jgi:hypothetical protein